MRGRVPKSSKVSRKLSDDMLMEMIPDSIKDGGSSISCKELSAEADNIEWAYRQKSRSDFMCFVRGLYLNVGGRLRVFDTVMAGFQRVCFSDLAKSLQNLVNGRHPTYSRFWIERTKKASKDADLAVAVLWVVAFAPRPIYCQVGAANKEQASIVKERITHLLHWNPWLNEYVEVVQWEVRSKQKLANGAPMAKLHIMSSDAAGSHGGTPDLLIINELSHMKKWEFAETLMDNADGVPRGVAIIATNAGFVGSKAEVWRKQAIASPKWVAHIRSKPAPWHSKSTIEEAKARNTKARYERLWRGKWTSGTGDSIDVDNLEACFSLDGPLSGPEDGWEYVAGLDLGIQHDHSAVAVLGVHKESQIIKLVQWKSWAPAGGREVDLIEVESACISFCKAFRVEAMYYDPFQAKLMAQRLIRRGIVAREMSFSVPNNLNKMATTLIQMIDGRKLKMYDDEEGTVLSDFNKLTIKEKSYGYKLDSVSDEYGHADIATAIVICLYPAVEMMKEGLRSLRDDDVLFSEFDGSDKDADVVDSMPSELRDIYNIG